MTRGTELGDDAIFRVTDRRTLEVDHVFKTSVYSAGRRHD